VQCKNQFADIRKALLVETLTSPFWKTVRMTVTHLIKQCSKINFVADDIKGRNNLSKIKKHISTPSINNATSNNMVP
jgi:hypothetical protein